MPGTHRRSVECIRMFMKLLRALKFGATIRELENITGLGRRQIHRWLNILDEVFGVERRPSDRVTSNWIYTIPREKGRERL